MYVHPGPDPVGSQGGDAGHSTGQQPPVRDAAPGHPPGQAPQAAPRQQNLTDPPPHGPGGEGPLLDLRSTIILMLGILVATAAGVLTYRAQQDAATAALASGGAFAGGVLFFQKIIAG
ncbi:hypothetical protein [Streptomyces anulatus]|uniref:hypothetical protein n=1 Tax=Streptomyces anulatus TaxID=1892 RepID=UPI002F90E4D2